MTEQEHKTFSKRRNTLDNAKRSFESLSEVLKEVEVSLVQQDNKLETQERLIIERKGIIAELDEKIRVRNLEANSSNLAIRDELDKRHQEVISAEARIKAREMALHEKEARVSALLDKAEKVSKKAANV